MKAILSKESVDEKDLRVDVAWELFYHGKKSISEYPYGKKHYPFVNWLWESLGQSCGPLKKTDEKNINIKIPELDEASFQFLIRVISPWVDEVYFKKDGKLSENLWKFPVTPLIDDENLDESEKSLLYTGRRGQDQRFLMPLLGPTRVFATIEILSVDGVSARMHSHSSVDEYYLILKGSGTLRMNGKEKVVKEGDFIAKPSQPENTSQLIANQRTGLRILDIEVWPDQTDFSKDLIHYPDHNEIWLRGIGWGSVFPSETSIPVDDLGKNYDLGYARNKDGSWKAKDIPGYKKRI